VSVLLTIDWDFFVIEKPAYDLGHQESLLFQNFIWKTRYNLRYKMGTTGEEERFWEILRCHFKFCGGIAPKVSESHVFGYAAAQGCEGVVLFDTHHDCWDTQEGQKIHCDNWLRAWLEEVPTRWAVWVYPEHAKALGAPEIPSDMEDRVDRVSWELFKKRPDLIPRHEPIGDVHLCRSGCWTPPWLDEKFIDFFSEGWSPDDFEVMQTGDWNPLKCRWTDKDEAEAKAHFERVEAVMSAARKS